MMIPQSDARGLAWLAQAGRALWPAVLAAAVLAAPAIQARAESRETMGAGDSIRITVFQNPDLTTETRIAEGGTIRFPLIGEVALGGLTPAEAAAVIADGLRRGNFMLNPQVSVAVTEVRSRQVSVLGQVARPGRYPLDGTRSKLTDILALAGGIAPTGGDTVMVMLRRNGTVEKRAIDVPAMYRSGNLTANVELQNGDEVYVPEAPVFYIYGEVQRAGAYRLQPDMVVMHALSLGGGLTTRGTARGLKIHRRLPDGTVQTLDAELTDAVRPNDAIYVREALF
jgi:polysaccharide export outer membrane protein